MVLNAPAAEEKALVEAAQAGDAAALRMLLERFSQPLYGAVILPRIGIAADAEDILRETLLRALKTMGAAMDVLNDRYRQAVTLRLLEERPREECASTMGVTVGNFDVILHRALAALRKAYGVR